MITSTASIFTLFAIFICLMGVFTFISIFFGCFYIAGYGMAKVCKAVLTIMSNE